MTRTNFLQDILSSLFERAVSGAPSHDHRSMEELCSALLSERGEASGSRIAAAILDRYEQLNEADKHAFFTHLADHYDLDAHELTAASAAYGEARDPQILAKVLKASEPRRQELLRRLNRVPGGTGRIVKMRADLLALLKQEPSFRRIDLDFQHLFLSWFNRGFLVLRHIDWRTPANILDKIIEYEAVHAIDDWDDLRRRLQPEDRRCFAFFHPAMPDEPLIFVEVALTDGIPGSIQSLLAENREVIGQETASTAVFYSISNCQKGLAGVSFGNFLIKQVALDLSQSLPNLKTFVTLSPVPGFVKWLKSSGGASQDSDAPSEEERAGDPIAQLLQNPSTESLEEQGDSLRALAATYLIEAKRDDGQPIDPVARFHLGNGARLEQINAGGDLSAKGRAQSLGVMVNYLYDLKAVEANHEIYAQKREVNTTRAIRALAAAHRASQEKTSRAQRKKENV